MGGRPIETSDMERHYRSRDYYGASSYYSSGRSVDVSPTKRVTNASQVFKETRMRDEFNPAKIKLPREACDSAQSPHSRGIIYLCRRFHWLNGNHSAKLNSKAVSKAYSNDLRDSIV